MRVCPPVTLAALGEPLLQAVGAIVCDHDGDAQLRIALLRAIDALLEDDEQGSCLGKAHGALLFKAVLLPSLVWRAGASLYPSHATQTCNGML